MITLSNKLNEKGTRLIYVALPCKGMIYPEVAVEKYLFRNGASTAPQWRKMVLEILESGVEVLDMFPVFQRYKEYPLFSYEHNISPEGADLTARFIANYIRQTSKIESLSKPAFSASQKNMWYHPWQSGAQEKHVRLHTESCIEKEGTVYLPFGSSSNICIFGNCNLQAFQYRGSGIAANLAYQLQMDIDYLGRTLIFGNGREAYNGESLKQCIQRDIAICISFPSGSFVRTAQLNREFVKQFIRYGRLTGQWSSINLDD